MRLDSVMFLFFKSNPFIMANTRLIPFNGDDSAYIRFLERRVFELEKSMACLSDSRMNNDFSTKGRNLSRAETSPNIIPFNRPLATKRTRGPPRRQEYSGQMNVEVDGLEVIEFCPNDTHSRPRKRVSRKGPKLRWQSDMDKFISLIQPLSEWTDHHPSVRDRSIPGFVQGRAFSHDIPEDQSSASSPQKYILSNLARFCDFAVSTNQSGAFYRQVRCFRELILFSLSNVVLKMGFDKGDVYQIIRKFSGSKADDKHLKKLLAGATWANHAISALSKTRWGSKAWEIFFAGTLKHLILQCYSFLCLKLGNRSHLMHAMQKTLRVEIISCRLWKISPRVALVRKGFLKHHLSSYL